MTDDRKKTAQEDTNTIETGLNALIEAIGSGLSDAFDRLAGGMETSVSKEQKIETADGPLHVQASVQVRLAGQGRAFSDPSNSATEPSSEASATTSLAYQLFEDETGWELTADVPGVTYQDLNVRADGATLVIETKGERHYFGRIELGQNFSLEDVAISLRSGVLTLQIRKAGAA